MSRVKWCVLAKGQPHLVVHEDDEEEVRCLPKSTFERPEVLTHFGVLACSSTANWLFGGGVGSTFSRDTFGSSASVSEITWEARLTAASRGAPSSS